MQAQFTKTENQNQNQDTRIKNLQFLSAKTQNPRQKLAKSAKPKIPMPPLYNEHYQKNLFYVHLWEGCPQVALHFLKVAQRLLQKLKIKNT